MQSHQDNQSPITKIPAEEDARAKKIEAHGQGFVLTKHHKDARRKPEDCDPSHFGCSPSLPTQETLEKNLR